MNIEAGDRVEFVQVEPGRFEVIAATRSVRELEIEGLTSDAPGLLPLVAVVDLVRVLESGYRLDRSQVAEALMPVLRGAQA
jgi:predicted nucleic-acid-binding protein